MSFRIDKGGGCCFSIFLILGLMSVVGYDGLCISQCVSRSARRVKRWHIARDAPENVQSLEETTSSKQSCSSRSGQAVHVICKVGRLASPRFRNQGRSNSIVILQLKQSKT